jgi:hypothetical protein
MRLCVFSLFPSPPAQVTIRTGTPEMITVDEFGNVFELEL